MPEPSYPGGRPLPAERMVRAPATPAPVPQKKQGLAVAVLAVVDRTQPGFLTAAKNFLEQGLGMSRGDARRNTAFVGKWADLPSLLGRYARIETLIFFAHGSAGALGIANTTRPLDLVAEDLKPPMPAVDVVQFETCNVGGRPDLLVRFGSALSARRVIAWNHYHFVAEIKVTLPSNGDVEDLKARLASYETWLLPKWPRLASVKGRQVRLGVEWFRNVDTEDPLPEALTARQAAQLRRTLKPRSDARDHVYTVSQMTDLAQQTVLPEPPLERVILELR